MKDILRCAGCGGVLEANLGPGQSWLVTCPACRATTLLTRGEGVEQPWVGALGHPGKEGEKMHDPFFMVYIVGESLYPRRFHTQKDAEEQLAYRLQGGHGLQGYVLMSVKKGQLALRWGDEPISAA